MYEQVSHSLLNRILDDLKPEIRRQDLRYFYTRLGANFYAIHTLFLSLYGQREDCEQQLLNLVEAMASGYIQRSAELERTDMQRELDHTWFLSQQWVGMALYTNCFANNLADLSSKTSYFKDLGVNMVHIMPILKCPAGRSDGGYAISDFLQIDDRAGSLEDFRRLASKFRQEGILLALDIVLNHTSEEHEWALRAKAGEERYQDYFHTFKERQIPDLFEQTMPEVFPENSPGNFTWSEEMGRWVMTVFHDYQWDLNYANPEVFIRILEIILFWANEGVDVMRLDAVAFLWKRLGGSCQNEKNAHLILQLLKDCCQVTAPGVLFIAEAIVAPLEMVKYFGEDAIVAKECEIAYNASLMALLWDAIATRNTRLLSQGIRSLPGSLERATWLNYVRCHDDIGFGFDDADIRAVGYEPLAHRRFLADYYTGEFDGMSRGLIFNRDEHTGAARICGTLASLAGLETALEHGDPQRLEEAVRRILLLHSMIFCFGGIPLLFNGDALGLLNDYSYRDDPSQRSDSRWVHRGRIDWQKAERRNQPGTLEHRLFQGISNLIRIRRRQAAFADLNNRELMALENEHLIGMLRFKPSQPAERVFVIANFDTDPHVLNLHSLSAYGLQAGRTLLDLIDGHALPVQDGHIVVAALGFHWLRQP
jgi:amylosucrase